jgi:predicted transcriptional regulator
MTTDYENNNKLAYNYLKNMESEWKDDEGKREYIHGIILNRGRQVDLHQYLMKHPDELLRGVLIAGSVGSGKTHRSISVVRSALDSEYGVLVFDPSNDYQRLLHEYEDGVVIDFSEYYMNPLEPPTGLTLEEWSSIFIQVFAQNYGLKDPSIAILQKSMNNLIDRSQKEHPTLSELLEEVVQFQPRSHSSETSSHASVQNRLESVLASEWSRCLDVRQGFSPEDFEEGLLIVKLRPVGIERVHELVVGLTVAKLFAYRSWKQNLGEPLGKNILVVIEEAHRFLSEGRQGDRRGQTIFLERALVESRKLGVGFVTVDQMPHRISDYVLGSCSLWVVCRLMDPNSRRMVGEALRTDVIWSHIGLMELPVGGAIIRVENQRELEDTSPMGHRNEKFLYDVKGLPATVALPQDPDYLLLSMESKDVWEQMIENERYLNYFERVLIQDYRRIKKSLHESEKAELRRFIAQLLGKHSEELTYPTQTSEIPSMDTFQIDECTKLLGVLSSRTKVRILDLIQELGNANTTHLKESVSRSQSWTSRSLGTMKELGLIHVNSGLYSITQKGSQLLHWGSQLTQQVENPDSEAPFEIETNDLRWLLSMVSNYRNYRENSSVAGWRGGQTSIEEVLRIEYLLHYAIERKHKSKTEPEINNELFQILESCMENRILTLLLMSDQPVRLRHINDKSTVGDRSIRRSVKRLEDLGILERLRRKGERGVKLHPSFRMMLNHLVSKPHHRIAVPVSLLQKSLRLVGNSILSKWLHTGIQQTELWNMLQKLKDL